MRVLLCVPGLPSALPPREAATGPPRSCPEGVAAASFHGRTLAPDDRANPNTAGPASAEVYVARADHDALHATQAGEWLESALEAARVAFTSEAYADGDPTPPVTPPTILAPVPDPLRAAPTRSRRQAHSA